jgi:hypothetical protein
LAAATGGLAKEEDAGGVAVEPVDQPGPLQPFAPGAEQAVDVVTGLGAALHRQARGLVQRQHLVVLVEHQRAGEGGVTRRDALALLGGLGRVRERRHAHLGARRQQRVGLDPAAVDADLARAQQLVELDVVQVRPATLEPAVDPAAVLTGVDEEGAHLPHANNRRERERPTNRAAMAMTTEAVT